MENTNNLPYAILKVGDAEYKLKISASAAIEIEQKTGKSLIAGMADLDHIETVILYLWGALTKYNSGIDKKSAISIYDDYVDAGGDMSDMVQIIFDTMVVSGFIKRQKAAKLLDLAHKAENTTMPQS